MTTSYTISDAVTFTVTHARYLASKVATDLKRIQRFYGAPLDAQIADYEAELTVFLKAGCLAIVTYGYRRDGSWIEPTVQYSARDLFGLATDDDPGRIRPGANTTGASFYSYLEYSGSWDRLSQPERDVLQRQVPVQRSGAPKPAMSGYFETDKTYSSGGRSLQRATMRSW